MSTQRAKQAQQDLQREQFDHELHRGLQSSMQGQDPFDEGGRLKQEYLDTLVDHGVDRRTADLLKNLLSRDFVLSKISSAEKEEMKWMVRSQFKKIKAFHPANDSPLEDDYRAVCYDDTNEQVSSLTQYQEILVEAAIWDIFFRIGRSVDGWQQEELSTQYNVSRVDKEDSEEGSRLGGLFS